ncbi:MAG: hypothetical protein IPO24_18640 [Bacteroidetes bacterium]|nr:hypothetical protein [Bacteroidota bacterium]
MMKNILLISALTILFSACSNLGERIDFEGDEVYYKAPITEVQAKQVGQFLKDYQYFTGNGFTVQVVKGENMTVNFATVDGIENDEEVIVGYYFLLVDMSNAVLDGNPIDIALCDDKLQVKKLLTFADAKAFLDKAVLSQ